MSSTIMLSAVQRLQDNQPLTYKEIPYDDYKAKIKVGNRKKDAVAWCTHRTWIVILTLGISQLTFFGGVQNDWTKAKTFYHPTSINSTSIQSLQNEIADLKRELMSEKRKLLSNHSQQPQQEDSTKVATTKFATPDASDAPPPFY